MILEQIFYFKIQIYTFKYIIFAYIKNSHVMLHTIYSNINHYEIKCKRHKQQLIYYTTNDIAEYHFINSLINQYLNNIIIKISNEYSFICIFKDLKRDFVELFIQIFSL